MGYKIKEFSLGEVLAAIKQNGYKKARNELVRYNPSGSVKSACAIGQGALNLGIKPNELFNQLPHEIKHYIYSRNDKTGLQPDEIADLATIHFNDRLNEIVVSVRDYNG